MYLHIKLGNSNPPTERECGGLFWDLTIGMYTWCGVNCYVVIDMLKKP